MRWPLEERARARLALVAVTMLWGSTFVVVRASLDLVPPFALIAVRFALASVVVVALDPRVVLAAVRLVPRALPLSLAMLLGFSLQTLGLATTTPSRSAFLTATSVLVVPVLDLVLMRRWPRPALLLGIALAAGGIAVLFHPIAGEWRRGDSYTLLGAVAFAWYIVELGRISRSAGARALVLVQSVTIAVLTGLASPWVDPERPALGLAAVLALSYLGIVCTAITFLLMTWGQARLEPVEAAIVYAAEPVWAALFSVAAGSESAGWKLGAGGSLLVAAGLVPVLAEARMRSVATK